MTCFANGNVVALGTLVNTLTVVGLVALLIRVRRYPVRDYLALTWPPARSILIALAGLAVLLCSSDLISYMLGRPLVPPVMVDVYRTAWLRALARLVLAPLGEETLFRGFLFKGIATSRGPVRDLGQLGRLGLLHSSTIGTGRLHRGHRALSGRGPLQDRIGVGDNAAACPCECVCDAGDGRSRTLAEVTPQVAGEGPDGRSRAGSCR